MEIANLTKQASAPPFRSDKVVIYADSAGLVWQRSSTGSFQLIRDQDLTTSLATKANTSHGHAIADTTGLQTALDGKEAVDAQRVSIGTVTASTSGTSIDFTGIPAGTRSILMNLSGVSTNGTSNWILQLGKSAGIENTGYSGGTGVNDAAAITGVNYSAGFVVTITPVAADTYSGQLSLAVLSESANTWTFVGSASRGSAVTTYFGSGVKSLAGTLDRVRLTATNGTDAFDAGSINILYKR